MISFFTEFIELKISVNLKLTYLLNAFMSSPSSMQISQLHSDFNLYFLVLHNLCEYIFLIIMKVDEIIEQKRLGSYLFNLVKSVKEYKIFYLI